eukprot:1979923-Prymnesium_polylepis.1
MTCGVGGRITPGGALARRELCTAACGGAGHRRARATRAPAQKMLSRAARAACTCAASPRRPS